MKRFLFAFAFFLSLNSFAVPLSGIYTIGGTAPSYATFTAAATALINNGISGPVTFNVRNGTYNEQVNLTTITGVSNTNTITFQSENNDSSLVTLTFTAQTASNNYVFQTFVSHIILHEITLLGPSNSTYADVFVGVNGASYIQILNCSVQGHTNAPTTGSQTTMIFTGQTTQISVLNSKIVGGITGLGASGGTVANPLSFWTISGNTLLNCVSGINVSCCNSLQITNNNCNSMALTSTGTGITVSACSTAVVRNNKVSRQKGYGIQISNNISTNSARAIVANNFVTVSGGNFVKGISITSSTFTDVFHNSIYTSLAASGAGEGIIIGTSGSSNNRIQNNSIVSMNSTAAVTAAASTYGAYDHCCLYTGGTPPVLPPNSIWADPVYNSITDLHVQNGVLNNIGLPLTSVTNDIDGDARSVSTPDIGADEYTPVSLNTGIDAVVSPNNLQVNCSSNFNIVLSMTNFGTVPLTSAIVKYKINGVLQPVYNWSGSLTPGAQIQFSPGAITLLPIQANSIQAWTESPNGGTDALHSDDSTYVNNLYLGMNGVYTIGGSSPDFATVNSAAVMLSSAGVCGAVTMNIRNGTYNEAVRQDSIRGTSPVNTVLYQSESGDSSLVNITWTTTFSQDHNFIIDKANYLTLRKLTFTQPSSPYNYCLITAGNLHDLTVENCVIMGFPSSTSSQTDFALAVTPDSNVIIRNNRVSNGNYTIAVSKLSGPNIKNVSITNNIIQGGRSLSLEKITEITVAGNTISTGGPDYGIYMAYCSNYKISTNRIRLNGLETCAGIYLQTCGGLAPGKHTVWNNSVNVDATAGNLAIGHGMWFVSSSNVEVYYNTVRYNSTDSDHVVIGIESSPNSIVKNNIFFAAGQSKVFYLYNSANLISDYNNIFTNGTKIMTIFTTLPAFTAYTGTDSNSVSFDPQFINSFTDSLYIGNPLVENICPPIPTITTDIHNFTRSTNAADPGAFETMTLPVVGLGNDTLACSGYVLNAMNTGSNYLWSTGETTQSISVVNNGVYWVQVTNPLGIDSDTINISLLPSPAANAGTDTGMCAGGSAQLNGAGGISCQWHLLNGSVFSSSYSTTVSPSSSACYVLSVSDANTCTGRDTVCVNIYAAPAVPVINLAGSDLVSTAASSYQWYLNGSIIPGETNQLFTPTQGGNYTVVVTDTNGCFSATSAPFVYSTTGITEFNLSGISIGPNPVTDNELFIFRKTSGNGSMIVELYDAKGVLVKRIDQSKKDLTVRIDMKEFSSGVYLLTITTDKGKSNKKIVKE